MPQFRSEKVVAALPDPLTPDTVYYVRTGEGFDIFVSDITGSTAHQLNTPDTILGYGSGAFEPPGKATLIFTAGGA